MSDSVFGPTRHPDLVHRAVEIICRAGYLTLATADSAGRPWAAQLQYAWFTSPLSLVFGSHVEARHSVDIAASGRAAAAASLLPGVRGGPDGLQVAGPCTALGGAALELHAAAFYRQMYADPGEARDHALSPEQLSGDAPLRLYELRVKELWILDLDRWAKEQVSARVQVESAAVEQALSDLNATEHAPR